MIALAPAMRFVGKACALAVLFLLVGSWLPYPAVFRAGGNFVFGTFGGDRVARFEALSDPTGMLDTRVEIGTVAHGDAAYLSSLRINSVREGLTPVIVFLALALATVLPWREKKRFIVVGFVLVGAFIAMRLGVALAYGFSRVQLAGVPLLDLGSAGTLLLHRLDQILSEDLHSTYVAPVIVWLALTTIWPSVFGMWRPSPAEVGRAPAAIPRRRAKSAPRSL